MASINNKPKPTIPINKIKRFEDFFRLFQEKPNKFKYREMISQIYAEGRDTLYVLFEELNSFDPDLARLLRSDPEELLPDAIEAFKNLLKYLSAGGRLRSGIEYFVRLRTENDSLFVPLRKIRGEHIDRLIFTKGVIVRITSIQPKIEETTFQCLKCSSLIPIKQISNNLIFPRKCIRPKCSANGKKDFRLITKNSLFVDWQKVVVQEEPEELPAGRMPRKFDAILSKSLVDVIRSGDRVRLMGVYKAYPNLSKRGMSSLIFLTYIDINSIETVDKDDVNYFPSKEELKEIRKLAQSTEIQDKITLSIAPIIKGRNDLKKATALSLFGGVRRKRFDGSHRRGTIHILFMGDASTGKSEILKSATDIAPRAMFLTGGGASGVGLTASIVKDPDYGVSSLDAGAVVLCDDGNVCIDEFDKTREEDVQKLHEAMEQNTVSIQKAGFHISLNARTGIIASGNPKYGRYNKYKTPIENIEISTTLASRFDLIFVVIDEPEKKFDGEVSDFMCDLEMGKIPTFISPKTGKPLTPIKKDLLKKYIHYARHTCNPELTKEAREEIQKYYLKLRGLSDIENAIISIVPRHHAALFRLCEAHARMALRDKIIKEDVEAIKKLFNRFLRDTGYDEAVGKFDIDRIFTGQSRSKVNKITKILDRIKKMVDENGGNAVEIGNVVEVLDLEPDLEKDFIEETINNGVKEGTLYRPKEGFIKYVSRG